MAGACHPLLSRPSDAAGASSDACVTSRFRKIGVNDYFALSWRASRSPRLFTTPASPQSFVFDESGVPLFVGVLGGPFGVNRPLAQAIRQGINNRTYRPSNTFDSSQRFRSSTRGLLRLPLVVSAPALWLLVLPMSTATPRLPANHASFIAPSGLVLLCRGCRTTAGPNPPGSLRCSMTVSLAARWLTMPHAVGGLTVMVSIKKLSGQGE
jgi:hypothetical protein